jgi:hypothetical protein
MGSKGSKPRKPPHSQHLPKVGTPQENEHEQRAARHAVAENMSFGGRPDKSGINTAVGVLAIAVVIAALAFLCLLVVLR